MSDTTGTKRILSASSSHSGGLRTSQYLVTEHCATQAQMSQAHTHLHGGTVDLAQNHRFWTMPHCHWCMALHKLTAASQKGNNVMEWRPWCLGNLRLEMHFRELDWAVF